MKKLEKLNKESLKIKKSEMATIKGGTTTTQFWQTGYIEMEQEVDGPTTQKPIGKPFPVEYPNGITR